MTLLKIHGGTVSGKENLCRTCSRCFIRKGIDTGRETMICLKNYETPIVLSEGAAECNEYEDKRRPPLYQMEKIAWQLNLDRKNVGFLKPEDVKRLGLETPELDKPS